MMKMEWNQLIKLFLKLNRSKGSDSILLTNGVGWGRGEREERKEVDVKEINTLQGSHTPTPLHS